MRILVLVLLLIFCALLLDGQNIIPNGNFEDTIPSFFGTVSAKNWVNPTNGSPDFYSKYHNKDAPSLGVPINKVGFQNTHSGKSYFGLLYIIFIPQIIVKDLGNTFKTSSPNHW